MPFQNPASSPGSLPTSIHPQIAATGKSSEHQNLQVVQSMQKSFLRNRQSQLQTSSCLSIEQSRQWGMGGGEGKEGRRRRRQLSRNRKLKNGCCVGKANLWKLRPICQHKYVTYKQTLAYVTGMAFSKVTFLTLRGHLLHMHVHMCARVYSMHMKVRGPPLVL